MFIKSKICFTVFVIYEIIAISLLHFQRTCDAMFSPAFCDSDFKYFAGAIAVPLLIYIIWMWVHEIVRAHRRRKFIRHAKQLMGEIVSNIHEKLENISPQILEQLIAAAIIMGIQRYSARHPNVKHTINQIIGTPDEGNMKYDYTTDTENAVAAQKRAVKQPNAKRTRKTATQQQKSKTRKK